MNLKEQNEFTYESLDAFYKRVSCKVKLFLKSFSIELLNYLYFFLMIGLNQLLIFTQIGWIQVRLESLLIYWSMRNNKLLGNRINMTKFDVNSFKFELIITFFKHYL